MTPKEKAFELVTAYSRILPINQTTLLDHKNCARIAVDEIVQSRKNDNIFRVQDLTYWQEVKQEIDKI